jgi:hypothetical protein
MSMAIRHRSSSGAPSNAFGANSAPAASSMNPFSALVQSFLGTNAAHIPPPPPLVLPIYNNIPTAPPMSNSNFDDAIYRGAHNIPTAPPIYDNIPPAPPLHHVDDYGIPFAPPMIPPAPPMVS